MSSPEKRTPKSWTHYLADDDNPITLMEYMAGCLSRILLAHIQTAQATGHTEGMVGTLDEFLHDTNKHYRKLAQNRSKPAPMLPEGEES